MSENSVNQAKSLLFKNPIFPAYRMLVVPEIHIRSRVFYCLSFVFLSLPTFSLYPKQKAFKMLSKETIRFHAARAVLLC